MKLNQIIYIYMVPVEWNLYLLNKLDKVNNDQKQLLAPLLLLFPLSLSLSLSLSLCAYDDDIMHVPIPIKLFSPLGVWVEGS